jgi:hypothetical protein
MGRVSQRECTEYDGDRGRTRTHARHHLLEHLLSTGISSVHDWTALDMYTHGLMLSRSSLLSKMEIGRTCRCGVSKVPATRHPSSHSERCLLLRTPKRPPPHFTSTGLSLLLPLPNCSLCRPVFSPHSNPDCTQARPTHPIVHRPPLRVHDHVQSRMLPSLLSIRDPRLSELLDRPGLVDVRAVGARSEDCADECRAVLVRSGEQGADGLAVCVSGREEMYEDRIGVMRDPRTKMSGMSRMGGVRQVRHSRR